MPFSGWRATTSVTLQLRLSRVGQPHRLAHLAHRLLGQLLRLLAAVGHDVLTRVGSSTYCWARSRLGASCAWIVSITGCLHSRQPIPAVVHPCRTHFFFSSSEYTR